MTGARNEAAWKCNSSIKEIYDERAGSLWGSFLYCLMATAPASLFAQVNPYTNRFNPYASAVESNPDPRARRAQREKAVAVVGPKARDFVESRGEEAVAAIFAVSKPVAEKLAEFHASGEMAKLPRPQDLLRIIARPGHGDDVALWAIAHVRELSDVDSFDAYLEQFAGIFAGAPAVGGRRRRNAGAAFESSHAGNNVYGLAALGK